MISMKIDLWSEDIYISPAINKNTEKTILMQLHWKGRCFSARLPLVDSFLLKCTRVREGNSSEIIRVYVVERWRAALFCASERASDEASGVYLVVKM